MASSPSSSIFREFVDNCIRMHMGNHPFDENDLYSSLLGDLRCFEDDVEVESEFDDGAASTSSSGATRLLERGRPRRGEVESREQDEVAEQGKQEAAKRKDKKKRETRTTEVVERKKPEREEVSLVEEEINQDDSDNGGGGGGGNDDEEEEEEEDDDDDDDDDEEEEEEEEESELSLKAIRKQGEAKACLHPKELLSFWTRGIQSWDPTTFPGFELLSRRSEAMSKDMHVLLERLSSLYSDRKPKKDFASCAKDIGNRFYRRGDFHLALIAYNYAVLYDPQEMRHRVNLSACLLEIGDYLEAALHCRLAALLYPRDHLEFPKSSMSSSDSFPLMMIRMFQLITKGVRRACKCYFRMGLPFSAYRSFEESKTSELSVDDDKSSLLDSATEAIGRFVIGFRRGYRSPYPVLPHWFNQSLPPLLSDLNPIGLPLFRAQFLSASRFRPSIDIPYRSLFSSSKSPHYPRYVNMQILKEADIKSWDVWMESIVDPLPILLMLAEIHQDRTPSSQFSVHVLVSHPSLEAVARVILLLILLNHRIDFVPFTNRFVYYEMISCVWQSIGLTPLHSQRLLDVLSFLVSISSSPALFSSHPITKCFHICNPKILPELHAMWIRWKDQVLLSSMKSMLSQKLMVENAIEIRRVRMSSRSHREPYPSCPSTTEKFYDKVKAELEYSYFREFGIILPSLPLVQSSPPEDQWSVNPTLLPGLECRSPNSPESFEEYPFILETPFPDAIQNHRVPLQYITETGVEESSPEPIARLKHSHYMSVQNSFELAVYAEILQEFLDAGSLRISFAVGSLTTLATEIGRYTAFGKSLDELVDRYADKRLEADEDSESATFRVPRDPFARNIYCREGSHNRDEKYEHQKLVPHFFDSILIASPIFPRNNELLVSMCALRPTLKNLKHACVHVMPSEKMCTDDASTFQALLCSALCMDNVDEISNILGFCIEWDDDGYSRWTILPPQTNSVVDLQCSEDNSFRLEESPAFWPSDLRPRYPLRSMKCLSKVNALEFVDIFAPSSHYTFPSSRSLACERVLCSSKHLSAWLFKIFCKFTGLSYFETANHKSSDRSFPDGLGWLSSPSPSLVSLLTVIPDALLHRGYPSHWICSSLESIYDMILRELLRPDFLVKSSSSSARSRAEAQRTSSADEKKKSRMSSSYETNLPYPRFSSGLSHYFLEMISLGSVSSLLGSHYLSIPYQNQKIYPAQYDPLFESMIVHSPLSPLPWLRGLLFLPSVDQSAICACLRSTRIGKVHFSLDRQILSRNPSTFGNSLVLVICIALSSSDDVEQLSTSFSEHVRDSETMDEFCSTYGRSVQLLTTFRLSLVDCSIVFPWCELSTLIGETHITPHNSARRQLVAKEKPDVLKHEYGMLSSFVERCVEPEIREIIEDRFQIGLLDTNSWKILGDWIPSSQVCWIPAATQRSEPKLWKAVAKFAPKSSKDPVEDIIPNHIAEKFFGKSASA